ncbi:hypothetical protein AWB76_00193 [Caballeronia temeraria]|uniref:Uncharacterized protein n=1 Tax=Caballeronia temeraria TaxID=1777137 RepID=A0A157Z516_9BURK|nr:hypothetical protein [Caballeronia temeraria]SAK40640.1 hypothetical protein AWB76_00193 [Caballeronia temeraria]
MCICYTGEHCDCYGDARTYRHERARQAVASRIEHDLLDLLDDPAACVVSPLAVRLADLIRARLDELADERGDGQQRRVIDVLVTGQGGAYFWLDGDGMQYHARLDEAAEAAPIRLVA